jgi:hypothetical protein
MELFQIRLFLSFSLSRSTPIPFHRAWGYFKLLQARIRRSVPRNKGEGLVARHQYPPSDPKHSSFMRSLLVLQQWPKDLEVNHDS